MKKLVLFGVLLVLAGCVTDGTRGSSSETARQYLARTKYMNTFGSYVLQAEGIDLEECATKPKRESVKITKPLSFKELMNFATFSSHSFGHPVLGKWEENIDLRPCGHNKTLKIQAEANNGEAPIFKTIRR